MAVNQRGIYASRYGMKVGSPFLKTSPDFKRHRLAGFTFVLLGGLTNQLCLAQELEAQASAIISCSSTDARTIQLADILVAALDRQPQLHIAQENVAKARANLIAGRSPFLPKLTLAIQSERFVPSNPTSPVTVGNVVVGGSAATKTTYGSIGLNWNLFNSGRDWAGFRASQADVSSSEAGLSGQLNDTLMLVLSAYTDVYQSQMEADTQSRVLALQQSIEDRVEEQFRRGLTTQLAIARAQTDVIETSQAFYQACRAVADKSAMLAQSIGLHLAPDELYRIEAPLTLPDHNGVNLVASEWQRYIQDSPSVVAAKESITAAEYRLKQARAAYGPSLSLEGRKDYLGQSVDSWRTANHLEPNSYRIGLQITQPMLPMTTEYSAIQSAKSDLRRAQASYQQALLDTEGRYHTAFNAMREASASLKAAEASLSRADDLLGLTRALYAAGREDQDKVQQAQITSNKAANAVKQADARLRVASWQVFRATEPMSFVNKLLTQFGIDAANP